MLDPAVCKKARLSRDPRFDGRFFTAVKTTKIYCRSVCPVDPPKEKNVLYYATAIEAANQGFRPCLRCRPDSAPGSPAWNGVNTTFDRALKLIDQGALQNGSLPDLAERLGISDRYLRQLFQSNFGVSPKSYALYQQCLFAKKLLHQTTLPITQVALASGFSSIRRFNDCFKNQLNLTPSQLRKNKQQENDVITLQLHYRPPYNWQAMQSFLSSRLIPSMEWLSDSSYGRNFHWLGAEGQFTAIHQPELNGFKVEIQISELKQLKQTVQNIKRILDLDVDINQVETDLNTQLGHMITLRPGLRLPGIWSLFEAGVRAILGQQVSVAAAKNLVSQFVQQIGSDIQIQHHSTASKLFPTPKEVLESDLSFFKMPASRKQTLHNLAQHFVAAENEPVPDSWLELKGIGPWTVDYAKMRGCSDPNIFLAGDLGVKKILAKHDLDQLIPHCAPWLSYLTFQLWNQL